MLNSSAGNIDRVQILKLGGGLIFILYLCSQTVKTTDFKRN